MAEPELSDQPRLAAPKLFLSYAREDRDVAQQLAHSLDQEGFAVWWDREIRGGSDFTDEIASNLHAARLVLVLWSPSAVRSSFVRDESARARDAGKLLPLRIEETELPLGFGQIQTLDLIDWDGDREAAAFQAVLDAIRRTLGQQPAPPIKPPGQWRLRKLTWPVVIVTLLGLVVAGLLWQSQMRQRQADEARAEQLFQNGVAAQFATEPNLESARNNYLSALELRPDHARTRYHLAHVYAQLNLFDDARADFKMALDLKRGLDTSQLEDAKKQLDALVAGNEPVAIQRAVEPKPAASEVPSAAAPAPAAETAEEAGAARERRDVVVALGRGEDVLSAIPPTADGPGRLPDVAPNAEREARIEPLIALMFAPDKQGRISATTNLIVNVDLTSDAVPLALKAALDIQAHLPSEPAAAATARSGVINTLVLLRSASPVTLRKNDVNVRLLTRLARSNGPQTAQIADEVEARLKDAMQQRPVAWIQIANDAQRRLAENLASRLRGAGYDVPPAENVGAKAPLSQSEIRAHGNSDQGFARWQVRLLEKLDVGEAKLSVLRKAAPAVDSYEIWFDRDLCIKRIVRGCASPLP